MHMHAAAAQRLASKMYYIAALNSDPSGDPHCSTLCTACEKPASLMSSIDPLPLLSHLTKVLRMPDTMSAQVTAMPAGL